jgi:hypothetical protein
VGHSLRINASNQPAWLLGNGSASTTVTIATAITANHNYLLVATYSGTTMTLNCYDLSNSATLTSNTGTLATGTYQPVNAVTCSNLVAVGHQAMWSTVALSGGNITALVNAAMVPNLGLNYMDWLLP